MFMSPAPLSLSLSTDWVRASLLKRVALKTASFLHPDRMVGSAVSVGMGDGPPQSHKSQGSGQ